MLKLLEYPEEVFLVSFQLDNTSFPSKIYEQRVSLVHIQNKKINCSWCYVIGRDKNWYKYSLLFIRDNTKSIKSYDFEQQMLFLFKQGICYRMCPIIE